MDDSISKALIMTAGVLLAITVIGFITFSFRRVGEWAQTKESERLIEQNIKFNKEYEVYDKDIMYGVDVISCLNKALSNNEAIVWNYGEKKDESYEIKVKVSIKTPLEESIKVYHINEFKEVAYANGVGPTSVNDYSLEDAGFSFLGTGYKNITGFESSDKLKSTRQTIKIATKEFNLTKDKTAVGEGDLRDLLSVASSLSEIVKNTDKENSAKQDGWTKAEFRSGLYDLKTRRFKCTNLTYSTQGRIDYIEFKEI